MIYPETYRQTPNITKGATNQRLGVVMHHTAGSYAGAVTWLTDKASKASAHVVIARDGRRTVLASDEAVTWHAGHGRWRGMNPNLVTLGVEFELTADQVKRDEALTRDQLASMLEWLTPRWERYGWKLEDMTHHREVDPGRKIDLSEKNWKLVQDAIRERFAGASLYTVDVDGRRDGVYRDPRRSVHQALERGAWSINIHRI